MVTRPDSNPSTRLNRERVRRDAERITRSNAGLGASEARALARDCLDLLAELKQVERRLVECAAVAARDRELREQAEQERDEARRSLDLCDGLLVDTNARLAKVPALVEALREACEKINSDRWPDAHSQIVEALTAWEQE